MVLLPQSPTHPTLYDTDFWAWTQTQVKLLQDQQWEHLDLPNLIEEIESLGRQQRQELRNRLSVLIGHLLKWHFQPEQRTRSWVSTIRIQRIDTLDLLDDNPSHKPYLAQIIPRVYVMGLELAIKETDLPPAHFPENCPYALEQILDSKFFSGEPSELLANFER
ncbi:DUF29 domain-containing protein [Thermosynechococcaceae cyanobacterium BACA0444]|uniref:DUF29 domain-containing protein n=1 Tax=Pseudocalidococcus azoricus BACA0444 TaxID=2918990 RepID=A0AAE4JZD5_9CYAN|nr:DUF29 domain-containing protein [Pseudocalidococcus azoricus]MDS3861974.1 DUF29 domain-containing protein [Pseudocalidococcus azoricus BACA0444]